MTIFYNLIFLLYSLFYIPALLFKGKFHRHFLERFGIFSSETGEGLKSSERTIWIHAVSVGEVSCSKSIINRLKGEFPDYRLVVSTTTRAGHHLAKYLFSQIATIIYFPLDLSFITWRVVRLVKPALFCTIETEIWPNLILALSSMRVPMVLLNGRISDKSFVNYMAASFFMRPLFSRITKFCMQSEVDAKRIRSIGASPDKVIVTGNLKFDMVPGSSGATRDLGLGLNEDLIVAGSTHHGEEKIILEVYRKLLEVRKGVRLLIAPRHIERIRSVESLIKKSNFKPIRVSRLAKAAGLGDEKIVLVLDTIGQLRDVYSHATIVFMGGSLIKKGGHNLVEPAIHAKPIIFGPYIFNFRDMSEAFLNNKAAMRVGNRRELLVGLERLLDDPKMRQELGNNAKRLVESNSGATEKTLDVIRGIMGRRALRASE